MTRVIFFLFFLAQFFLFSAVSAVGTITPPTVKLDNPISCPPGDASCNAQTVTTPQYLLGRVIKAALGVLGSVALVVFLYGGALWLVSAGSEEKVHMGLNAMLYAAIGIFIVFGSYGALNYILQRLAGAGGSTATNSIPTSPVPVCSASGEGEERQARTCRLSDSCRLPAIPAQDCAGGTICC